MLGSGSVLGIKKLEIIKKYNLNASLYILPKTLSLISIIFFSYTSSYYTHTHNTAQLHKQGVLGKSKEDPKKGGQKKWKETGSEIFNCLDKKTSKTSQCYFLLLITWLFRY